MAGSKYIVSIASNHDIMAPNTSKGCFEWIHSLW